MGFRFQNRIKILPGATVNLGKRGISTSFGVRGARVNIGRKGVRSTLGIPGTGISYTKYESYKKKSPAAEKPYLTECPSCGHHLRKYWDRCPACHAPLAPYYKEEAAPSPDTVVCPRCGGTVRASGTVNFCPSVDARWQRDSRQEEIRRSQRRLGRKATGDSGRFFSLLSFS